MSGGPSVRHEILPHTRTDSGFGHSVAEGRPGSFWCGAIAGEAATDVCAAASSVSRAGAPRRALAGLESPSTGHFKGAASGIPQRLSRRALPPASGGPGSRRPRGHLTRSRPLLQPSDGRAGLTLFTSTSLVAGMRTGQLLRGFPATSASTFWIVSTRVHIPVRPARPLPTPEPRCPGTAPGERGLAVPGKMASGRTPQPSTGLGAGTAGEEGGSALRDPTVLGNHSGSHMVSLPHQREAARALPLPSGGPRR